MPLYRVRWEIDVAGNTPEEAAAEARRVQADPNTYALVFEVRRFRALEGEPWKSVDLYEQPASKRTPGEPMSPLLDLMRTMADRLARIAEDARNCEPLEGPELDEIEKMAVEAKAWIAAAPEPQRLAAAAPDLLNACLLLMQAYRNGQDNDASMDWSDVDLAWDAAKKAVAFVRPEENTTP
jgi:antitoxin component HigA of HigAB toxin-antitoxin module